MKLPAERMYWIVVGTILFFAVSYLTVSAWESYIGRIEGEVWRGFLLGPAVWILPSSLMWGALFVSFALLSSSSPAGDLVQEIAIPILLLLTVGMSVWFYRSRRAPLKRRVAVLAALLAFGVVPPLITMGLMTWWITS